MIAPDDAVKLFDFFPKIFEYAWAAVMALVGVVYKSHKDELKAMRKHLDEKIEYAERRMDGIDKDTNSELTTQRGHIAKIYDKLEENSRRAEDRHVELLKAIHTGLSMKADK